MRAIIVIALIVGAIGWGSWKTWQMINLGQKPEAEEKAGSAGEKSQGETGAPGATVPQEIAALQELERRLQAAETLVTVERERRAEEIDREREAADKAAESFELGTYRFRNRVLPEPAEIEKAFPGAMVDAPTNSVIIRAPDAVKLFQLTAALQALDIAPEKRQYRVEAVLLSLELRQGETFSADWVYHWASPTPLATLPAIADFSPGLVAIESPRLELAIERAKTAGAARVLSRPSLMVAAGEVGRLSSGREVPIAQSEVSDGNVSASIQYRQVALELEVSIREVGDRIEVDVDQVAADVAGTALVQGDEVPIIQSQSVRATIAPQFGAWYPVGSVQRESADQSRRFGWLLLRDRDRQKTRSELGLFLRVVDPATVAAVEVPGPTVELPAWDPPRQVEAAQPTTKKGRVSPPLPGRPGRR